MPPKKKEDLSRASSTSSINSETSDGNKKRKVDEVEPDDDDNNSKNSKSRITMALLHKMLEDIKKDTGSIPAISSRLDEAENKIKKLEDESAARVDDVRQVNERIDGINNVKINKQMMRDVDFCKAVLQVTVPEINRSLLRSNNRSSVIKDVIISGFPCKQLNNQQLIKLSFLIFKEIKVKLEKNDITDAFYLLKKEDVNRNVDDMSEDQTRVPFVVKLGKPALVKKIIAAKRKCKKMVFSKITAENDVLNLLRNDNDFTIFINESLSKFHYNLLKVASKKLKNVLNFKKVWQSNGFIYVQFSDELPLHQVSSESDIERLSQMYPKNQ